MKTRKMKLRTKIMLSVFVCIIGVISVISFLNYIILVNRLELNYGEKALLTAEAAAGFFDQNLLAQLKSDTRDGDADYLAVQKYLQEMRDAWGVKNIYIVSYDGMSMRYGVDADNTATHATFGSVFEGNYEHMRPALNGTPFAEDEINNTRSGKVITAYVPLSNDAGTVSLLVCDYDASSIDSQLRAITILMFAVAGFAFVIACAVVYAIICLNLRGLNSVNEKIYELANRDGDLTYKLDIHSGDELELVADNVNSLLERIRTLIVSIAENSKLLTEGSDRMNASVLSANDSVQSISATMEEMSAGSQETSASMMQITEEIERVRELINEMAAVSGEQMDTANGIIRKVADLQIEMEHERTLGAQRVADAVNGIKEKVEAAKQVKEIAGMTEEILNIAGQTNLLALNASIEAARAGEAGRGFAVVADEIRSLADSSRGTANRIQVVSESVVTSVNDLVESVNHMADFVQKQNAEGHDTQIKLASDYEQDVKGLSDAIQKLDDASNMIQSSVNSISESASSINIAVEETAKGITSTATSSSEILTEVQSVRDNVDITRGVTEDLRKQVNKFKYE